MVPYLRVANVLDGVIDYSDVNRMHFSASEQQNYTVRRGDILLNEGQSTELVGRSAIFDGPEDQYCFQNSLVSFRCGPSVVPRFARAVFKRWLDTGHFTTIVKQTTSMAHLGAQRFANLKLEVPPVPEQIQIAAVLDTIDDTIRKTEEIIAKLKQVKQGLLHDLLTRGIDENGELRDPDRHPEQFKDSALGRIPREWEPVSFGRLCSSSAFGPRFSSSHYAEDGGLAMLRTTDMDADGNIDLTTMPRAAIAPSVFASHLLQHQDLLISRSGTCGIAAVFSGHHLPVIPAAFLIRFRLSEPATARFYRRYFNSNVGRPGLARLAVGGVQKNIKGSEVLRLPVPQVPPREARLIAAVLDSNETGTEAELTRLSKLRLLKTALMDDLLTGRVRTTALLPADAR